MSYGSSLRNSSNSLNGFKASLNFEWQAEEMKYINNAIDSINRKIIKLASDIDSIDSDIECNVQEIRAEGAAKEKAVADAKANKAAQGK